MLPSLAFIKQMIGSGGKEVGYVSGQHLPTGQFIHVKNFRGFIAKHLRCRSSETFGLFGNFGISAGFSVCLNHVWLHNMSFMTLFEGSQ